MAGASETLHENEASLRDETKDHHRALVSIQEELEAVDWYNQRVDAAKDPELAAILAHNRDEEKEHLTMLLEWLRRRDDELHDKLSTYLFTDRPILEVEEEGERAAAGDEVAAAESLGIGSLKGEDL